MRLTMSQRCSLAGLVTGTVMPAVARACPLCKDALSGDPVGSALSWTTLLMILCPSGLVTLLGGWIFFVYWRAAQRTLAGPADDPSSLPYLKEKESET